MAITDLSGAKASPNGQSATQPPTDESQPRRGRPPDSERKANVKELSTESLIDLDKEIESHLATAKGNQEAINLFADMQLLVLTLKKMLIEKLKAPRQ